jgi:hypothetical protein
MADRCPKCRVEGFQSGEFACASCGWKDPVLEPSVSSGWYQDPANPNLARYWNRAQRTWVGEAQWGKSPTDSPPAILSLERQAGTPTPPEGEAPLPGKQEDVVREQPENEPPPPVVASRTPLRRLLEFLRLTDRCPRCGRLGFRSGECISVSCGWKDPILEPWVPSGWYQDPANPELTRYWNKYGSNWVGKARKHRLSQPIPTAPPPEWGDPASVTSAPAIPTRAEWGATHVAPVENASEEHPPTVPENGRAPAQRVDRAFLAWFNEQSKGVRIALVLSTTLAVLLAAGVVIGAATKGSGGSGSGYHYTAAQKEKIQSACEKVKAETARFAERSAEGDAQGAERSALEVLGPARAQEVKEHAESNMAHVVKECECYVEGRETELPSNHEPLLEGITSTEGNCEIAAGVTPLKEVER